MKDYIENAPRLREILLKQGLRPELLTELFQVSIETERENFEMIRAVLDEQDQDR